MLEKNILNPKVSLIADCHTCGERVLFGREVCPYCGITLDLEDLFPSAAINYVLTRAISSANDIRGGNIAVFLSLGITVFALLGDMPFWFHLLNCSGWGVLIIILLWFWKHGRWRINDREYESVKREMKGSLRMWLIANAFNLIVLILTWVSPYPEMWR